MAKITTTKHLLNNLLEDDHKDHGYVCITMLQDSL